MSLRSRWLRAALLLALPLIVLASSSPDAAPSSESDETASPLPFTRPLRGFRSTHVSSPRHRDTLLHSAMFDTDDEERSVFAALKREDDTREFSRWIEAEAAQSESLRARIKEVVIWTVWAPSNSAVRALFASLPSSDSLPPLSLLLSHFMPSQSFVLFANLPSTAIAVRTARRGTLLVVCDLPSLEQCERAGAALPLHDHHRVRSRIPLLHSQVLARNRLAGNGVIHVVDHVLGVEQRNQSTAASARNASTAAAEEVVNAWSDSSSSDSSSSSPPSHSSSSSGYPPRVQDHRPCPSCPPSRPRHVRSVPPPGKIEGKGRLKEEQQASVQNRTDDGGSSSDRGYKHDSWRSDEHDAQSHEGHDGHDGYDGSREREHDWHDGNRWRSAEEDDDVDSQALPSSSAQLDAESRLPSASPESPAEPDARAVRPPVPSEEPLLPRSPTPANTMPPPSSPDASKDAARLHGGARGGAVDLSQRDKEGALPFNSDVAPAHPEHDDAGPRLMGLTLAEWMYTTVAVLSLTVLGALLAWRHCCPRRGRHVAKALRQACCCCNQHEHIASREDDDAEHGSVNRPLINGDSYQQAHAHGPAPPDM